MQQNMTEYLGPFIMFYPMFLLRTTPAINYKPGLFTRASKNPWKLRQSYIAKVEQMIASNDPEKFKKLYFEGYGQDTGSFHVDGLQDKIMKYIGSKATKEFNSSVQEILNYFGGNREEADQDLVRNIEEKTLREEFRGVCVRIYVAVKNFARERARLANWSMGSKTDENKEMYKVSEEGRLRHAMEMARLYEERLNVFVQTMKKDGVKYKERCLK